MRHEVSGKSEKGRNDRLCGTIVWMHNRAIQVRVCKCTEKWKEMGYQLDLGPNCYAEHGIGISAAPEECGKELTEYYVSEKNDCLISCGGGELMCEDLDYVDFEKIRKAPAKWYLGYSDNTHFYVSSADHLRYGGCLRSVCE